MKYLRRAIILLIVSSSVLPALQNFVVQLTGPGTYLATAKAVRGGGYSAIIESTIVGPEGGQHLVEETAAVINSLWPKE